MPEKYYEILSLGFRYWFTLLGVLIVWRSFRWLRHDRAEKHRRIRQLPDAGTIGEMVVLEGNDEFPEGTTIPVPWEGVLGFVRSCDMVLPVSGVARQHADFSFRNGDGLMVVPRHGCVVEIDGEKITGRKAAKVHTMHHGSCLRIGEALLRLRVFMGLETERFARTLPEDEPNNPVAAPQGQGMPMRETPYPMQGQDAQGYATGIRAVSAAGAKCAGVRAISTAESAAAGRSSAFCDAHAPEKEGSPWLSTGKGGGIPGII